MNTENAMAPGTATKLVQGGLRENFKGKILVEGDAGYDKERKRFEKQTEQAVH